MITKALISSHHADYVPAVIEGLALGAFVWACTYVGIRFTPPARRNGSLALVLGLLYAVVGITLSIPRKTHAVLVSHSPGESIPAHLDSMIISITAYVLFIAFALGVPRGLAFLIGVLARRSA